MQFLNVSIRKFLVKWLGYEKTHNTHEPWKQLKDNVKLHEFLISKNLKHIIPRKYIPSTNASSETNETADDSENYNFLQNGKGRCSRIRYTRYTRSTVYRYGWIPVA